MQKQRQQKRTKSIVYAMSTDGNKVAAKLYSEHNQSLKRYVLRLVPESEPSHADDVVQETFAHTVKHLNNGKKVTSKGFLFRIARNLIVTTFYRNRQNTQTDATPEMYEFATDANRSSPERRVMVQQQLDALSVGIEGLPERYKEAFYRRCVWGESCREISATMGTTEHTVANYVGRGGR